MHTLSHLNTHCKRPSFSKAVKLFHKYFLYHVQVSNNNCEFASQIESVEKDKYNEHCSSSLDCLITFLLPLSKLLQAHSLNNGKVAYDIIRNE